MNAFDYTSQTWHDGLDALKLQIQQTEKTLEVLRGDDAQKFVSMTYGTIAGRIASEVKTLDDLQTLERQRAMADAAT